MADERLTVVAHAHEPVARLVRVEQLAGAWRTFHEHARLIRGDAFHQPAERLGRGVRFRWHVTGAGFVAELAVAHDRPARSELAVVRREHGWIELALLGHFLVRDKLPSRRTWVVPNIGLGRVGARAGCTHTSAARGISAAASCH